MEISFQGINTSFFDDSGWNDDDIIIISFNIDKICVKRKKITIVK